METVIWIAVAGACLLAVWGAAPYHQRIIDNRPIVTEEPDQV